MHSRSNALMSHMAHTECGKWAFSFFFVSSRVLTSYMTRLYARLVLIRAHTYFHSHLPAGASLALYFSSQSLIPTLSPLLYRPCADGCSRLLYILIMFSVSAFLCTVAVALKCVRNFSAIFFCVCACSPTTPPWLVFPSVAVEAGENLLTFFVVIFYTSAEISLMSDKWCDEEVF